MTNRIQIIVVIVLFQSICFAKPQDSLIHQAKEAFGFLPQQMISTKNPITPEKVILGKTLFYETRISVDGTVSCARCHPMDLYAADGLPKSIGNSCRINPRNAPTLFNAAGQISEHWIGNRVDVEDQAKQAIIGPPSFGMPSFDSAVIALKGIPGYAQLFRNAFPAEKAPITIDNFAKAIGAFERTLVTPSPFDAYIKGDQSALPSGQKAGLKAFIETGCAECHSGAYIGGQSYRKFGIVEPYWEYTKSKDIDLGRFVVTKNDSDKYVFRVPILRNVEKTPPYFHDGSVAQLREAIRIMGKVQLGQTLDETSVNAILVFLQSLTGQIPKDCLVLPILPARE